MEHVSKSIWIGRDAYMYLSREMRRQRGCKPLNEKQEDKRWKDVIRWGRDEKVRVDDDSFGGGDGTYEGRWWPWSVDTLKRMLTDAGYAYEDGEEVRSFSIF